MQIGALGDIHGDFESARRIMRRHPDVAAWICVGDLPGDEGRYEPVDTPLYFIKGNNENFDVLTSGELPAHLHYLPNAIGERVGDLTIAGLGGTLAPTWYETRAADLPHPKKGTPRATELADKRRHFVREEVEVCRKMRGVDIFLTHEAPRPFRVGGMDAGKTPINEILAGMRPRLHLFGHHHRFSEQDPQGVRSVGLDLVSRSYLLIDGRTLSYEHLQS
jgi:Icc-related predicted phosphoesterase